MKHLALLACLLLAACGATTASVPAAPPTAPDFDSVPLAFADAPWTTETGGFGARVLFAGHANVIGWAVNEGDPITFLPDVSIDAGEEWSLVPGDPEEPPAGWLYVEAQVSGQQYAALIHYLPGFNDGWAITRNDLWIP